MLNKSLAVCWIGIGQYNVLFDEFHKSFSEKFCPELKKTFFIFTDKPDSYQSIPNSFTYAISHACTHKGFVLFRKWKYCLMAEDKLAQFDYVCFANGNMICKEVVYGHEVIDQRRPLAVITHPCTQYVKAHTDICNPLSHANFCPIEDWQYKQAGFNVSTHEEFLKMANAIEGWRHLDKASGADKYVPWHDETYANRYFYENRDRINVLDGQTYCFPQGMNFPNEKYHKCKLYTRDKVSSGVKDGNYKPQMDAYQL